MKTNKKSGISLIVLVITIIVIIILAVAVILSLSNNNPIENSKQATFQNDLKSIQEEVNLYIANELSRTRGTYKLEDCNFSGNSMASTFSTSGKYTDKVQVYQGKVIYKGNNVSEKNWADEVGVPVYETFPTDGTTKDGLTYSKGTLSGSYTGTAQNIIIPDGVTSINSAVFSSKKTSIKNILLPNTVTKITAASFMGWSSLKSLIIPESVTELGAVFLSGCSNVEYIRIPKTVTTIQTCTFSGSSLKKIVVENGSPFKEEDKDQFLNGGPNGWGQPSDCEVIFE